MTRIFRPSKSSRRSFNLAFLVPIIPVLMVACREHKTGLAMTPEISAIVVESTEAQVFRVSNVDDEGVMLEPKGRPVLANNCVVLAGPIKVSGDWAARLRKLLARVDSDEALEELGAPECATHPGVAVRFGGKQEQIDMLICFECTVLEFAKVGAKESVWGGNFGPYKSAFAELVKEVFPNDKVIQGL